MLPVLRSCLVVACLLPAQVLADVTLFFPPEWKDQAEQAKAITDALSSSSGVTVKPQIAQTYPQIIEAFAKNEQAAVFIGSFVQAVLFARGLSVPLAQGINGKELYSSVMVVPATAGTDPQAILRDAGQAIAYAKAASSGEAGAKAASGGQAAIGTNNHGASVNAVKAGKAKAAFVKNFWWDSNKDKYPGMVMLTVPGVSEYHNPDFVFSASKSVPADQSSKLQKALDGQASLFGVQKFVPFDQARIQPTLELFKAGKIDPANYVW